MIALDVDGAVATITLSRPPVNAFNPQWVTRFGAVLGEIEANGNVAVVRVCSTERVFCAGADLTFMNEHFHTEEGRAKIHEFVESVQRAFFRLESLSATTIAQIEGPAVGGGLELALACDFRVIADTASVALPEIILGLIPGAGGTQRLSRLAGTSVARRLILTGRAVPAAEATQLRICDWVEPRAATDAACRDLALHLAAFPRDAMSACVRCIDASGRPNRDGFREELDATAMLLNSPSTHERVQAFLSKNAARR